jgi:glyoxylase-like metal-dependent hydrolase (beta-lactamase superfamily II)
MKLKDIIPLDGNTQLLDGGAMFGNAPKEMWKNWITVDSLNRIPLACRCLLIKINGKNCLFETGIGSFFDPKMKERFGVVEKEHILLKSLEKHNLTHKDIDYVVLSHLHFDHAGGTLSSYDEGELHLLFPNAKYFVSKQQWERALNPHSRDKASYVPVLNNLLEKSGRLVLIESGEKTELDHFIQFHFSNGHTPGLMLSEIQLESGPLIFASDLIPGRAWVHVPISMGYDRFPELVIDEKNKLLNDLVARGGYLFFTHDHECAVGKLKIDEKGKFSVEKIL